MFLACTCSLFAAGGQVEHKAIPGVTSAMMAWWFNGNIDGDMVWNGVRYPRYLLWHPRCVVWAVVSLSESPDVGILELLTAMAWKQQPVTQCEPFTAQQVPSPCSLRLSPNCTWVPLPQ